MKGKTKTKMSTILAVLLMTLGMFAVLPAYSQVTPTMYIDPAYVNGGLKPGNTFEVTLMIKNFEDMYLWQAGLSFSPSVLECTSVDGGTALTDDVFDVLAPTLGTLFIPGAIDNVAGNVGYSSQGLMGVVPGVTDTSGTGFKLLVFHFKVIGYTQSSSPIDIKTYFVLDSEGAKTIPDAIGGAVETVVAPAPYGPTAAFSWLPIIPIEGTEVTFDASASLGGFDGTSMCPITEYSWDFDGDLVWDVVTGSKVTPYTFPTAGDYGVTLEVYAPGATPDTDSITKTVKVIPPPMGAAIDLTAPDQAPHDGEGPDVECDAFAPQQLVRLCAKVTYNLDPVEGKLVGFEVTDADGNCVTYRTATTNAYGIALVNFRIPSMPVFGTWMATAIVDVAETTVADTMTFEVGWMIEIISVAPTYSAYNKCNDMYFELTIKNIALSTKIATLTVVVYDECGVPIGQVVIPDWAVEAGFNGAYATITAIHVPTWAFIGTATVYANAYTALPSTGGVPYCPEADAGFLIEIA